MNRISAHGDAANSITFLNENQFFTNSDDKTIKLWDVRQQQESVLCLRDQHNDWVKNVSIINEQTILTGGFDGRLVSWDLSKPIDNRSVKSRVVFSGGDRDSLIRDYQTDSLTRDHYMPRSHFFLRTAFNQNNKALFISFLLPQCLLVVNNFDVETFDESFLHKVLTAIESTGHRSNGTLFKNEEQSVAMIGNWNSLYREEKPIVLTIKPHPRSSCILIRSTHGPTDDYKEFTSVLDTQVETFNWPYTKHGYHQFNRLSKRVVPFTTEEPVSRDEIVREGNFSDCGNFIASPFGAGCRLLAFDKNITPFDSAHRIDEQKQFHDVVFKRSQRGEEIISAYFSSYMCQLACGTSRGTIQLYSPEAQVTNTIYPRNTVFGVRRRRQF